jgi:HPt (histidine-containing phosphotransfer) domain-containing protein
VSRPQDRYPAVWEPEALARLGYELGDSDGSVLDAIVSLYLTQGRELVDRLVAAAEASDAVTLRDVAHSLRGSTLTVGGARLAAICKRVELAGSLVEAQDAARSVPEEFEALEGRLAGGRSVSSSRISLGGIG